MKRAFYGRAGHGKPGEHVTHDWGSRPPSHASKAQIHPSVSRRPRNIVNHNERRSLTVGSPVDGAEGAAHPANGIDTIARYLTGRHGVAIGAEGSSVIRAVP